MFKQHVQKIQWQNFFVLHLNVRSLSQNLESLNELLATIKFELKVIYLTEPWMVQEMKHYLI